MESSLRSTLSSFWAEPESENSSLPSSQSQSMFFERLTEYWKTLDEFLSPELRLPGGGSPDPNIASLASTLLQLQQSVQQQFRLADAPQSSRRGPEEEKKRGSWILDPQAEPILPNNVSSARRSICGASFPSRSVSTNDNNDSLSDDKRRKSCSHSVTSPTFMGQTMMRQTMMDQTIMDQTFSLEQPLEQPTQAISDDHGILERLLENIRFKISKAKWTRDLQEFITDYSLNSTQLSDIHKSMLKASHILGRRCVRDLSNSSQRPCWGIAGSKVMKVFGEREGKQFYAMGKSRETDFNVHTIYVFYDFNRMQISIKAVCSPIDESMIDGLGDDDDSENDSC